MVDGAPILQSPEPRQTFCSRGLNLAQVFHEQGAGTLYSTPSLWKDNVMTKTLKPLLAAMVAGLVLAGCGGGSDSSSSNSDGGSGGGSNSGGSGGSSGGGSVSATQASSLCSGTGGTNSFFDVYVPTANGIYREQASDTVTAYGSSTDASQCLLVGSTAAHGNLNQLMIATTDAWANAIGYFEAVIGGTGTVQSTNPLPGGIQLNQQLFVACDSSSDSVKYLGVPQSAAVGSSYIDGSVPASTVAKNVGFSAYGCVAGSSGVHAGTDTGVATFGSDGSLTVTDSGSPVLTVAAADVPSLFSDTGYTVNGTTYRWSLYQLNVGGTQKQVIVHRAQKANGDYGLLALIQP